MHVLQLVRSYSQPLTALDCVAASASGIAPGWWAQRRPLATGQLASARPFAGRLEGRSHCKAGQPVALQLKWARTRACATNRGKTHCLQDNIRTSASSCGACTKLDVILLKQADYHHTQVVLLLGSSPRVWPHDTVYSDSGALGISPDVVICCTRTHAVGSSHLEFLRLYFSLASLLWETPLL